MNVSIEGVTGALRDNVLLFLSIEQQKDLPDMDEGRLRLLHSRAPDEIRSALEPFGYYHPRIDAQLTHERDPWQAHYAIDLGDPVRVTRMDLRIEGDAERDTEFQKRIAELPLKQGDILNHGQYEALKRSVQNLGAQRGYFDAQLVTSEVRVDLAHNSADVVLHYTSGPRYRFGPIRFLQSDSLDEQFLRRYLQFKQGDPYTSTDLLKLQSDLSDSDYFTDVDVRPRRDQTEDLAVPVDVKLTLRNRNKYTLGLGYGTDTGVRGKAGWERRVVDAHGKRFSTELSASQISTTIGARYRIPVRDPRTDQVVLDVGWTSDYPPTSNSDIGQLGVTYNESRGDWRGAYALSYRKERYRTGSDFGESTLLMPELNWQWVKADDRIRTRRGSRLQLDFRGADDGVVSSVTFFQARLAGKYILPLGDRSRLLSRIDAGHTSVQDFDKLPASIRYYTGGDQSVRGYGYNSIGPKDAAGEVIGGKYLLVGSAELEYRVLTNWSAAVFYDIGNAYNTSSDPFKEGAGTGIRWLSPIGPIRMDIAWALSEDGRPWRFHLVVGPDL